MKKFSKKKTPNAVIFWARPLTYLQIAIQFAMAVSPFWATTVHASKHAAAENTQLQSTADKLSQFGQTAQSGNLKDLPAQQATGFATQRLEQWLQNFGTARVELGTDQRFNAQSGAIDLLLPLDKSKEHLFFSQSGLRHNDNQLTGNLGLGVRHFVDEWMLGYNAFYDQNISRGHKRLGSGVEAWRDYLKLSSNGYWRLSGWRDSGDVQDYDARPANGFDVRAEAWLPAYPALGGRLMYEKYYGDEVALFNKDKRQNNPDAITAGLNWTPVPLISFSADHKKGGSQSETTLGVQLSWQFGQSLATQLDAGSVGNKRTLAGSGMDLVERNNNIVLEYRKQQLIELSLPPEVIGESSKILPITYRVQSKYGFAKIIWNDAAIIAAGGKGVDQGNGNYQLTLPKYVPGAANRYELSGVAHDTRSNTSKVAKTVITVNAPAFSLEKSSTLSSTATLLADGTSTALISLHVVDANGQAITGLASELTANVTEKQDTLQNSAVKIAASTPAKPASLSPITEQADGSYQMVLTAGNRPAEVTIATQLNNVALPDVLVQQISDAATAALRDGDVIALQDNAIANGLAENQVRARITDATGNPVANIPVTFTLGGSAQVAAGSSLTITSDKNGYSILKFTDRKAETVMVGVKTSNGSSAQLEMHFKVDSENPDAANSSLAAAPTTFVADGHSTSTVTLQLKDAGNNAIAGQTVTFASSLNGSNIDTTFDMGDGSYTANLTSIKAGKADITVKVNGRAFAIAPVTVTALGDSSNIDASQSQLATTPATIIANGSDAATLTLHLKDRNANPISGQVIAFRSNLAGSNIGNTIDNGDGSYSATLSSTKSGDAAISVTLAGATLAVNAANVTVTADSTSAKIASNDFKVNKTTLVADNTDEAVYTVTVTDANGNPVANQTISWSVDLGATSLSNATSVSDHAGQATVALKSMRGGSAVVSAKLNNNAAMAAQAITVILPTIAFSNGNLLSADEIYAVLMNTEHAHIRLYNGHWVENVIFPDASSLKDRKLTIIHSATNDTNLVVNGDTVVMNGISYDYTSDGSKWIR